MIDVPTIVQTAPQRTAFIHVTCPREQIRQVMGPGITELQAVVAAQGVPVTGPWFTHHLKNPGENFDFEICLPVASPVTPTGRVQAGELRAARVARVVYHGGYEGAVCIEPHSALYTGPRRYDFLKFSRDYLRKFMI